MPDEQTSGLPPEICQQLHILSKSQWYMIVTIGAILLSYYSLNITKKNLICSATDPELCKCLPKTLPIQTVSSIMILLSLFFYVQISGKALCQVKEQCDPKQIHNGSLNHLSNILVLLAGMIRFGLLVTRDDTTIGL